MEAACECKTAEPDQDAGFQIEGRAALIYVLSQHSLAGLSPRSEPVDSPANAPARRCFVVHNVASSQEYTKTAQDFGVHEM